MKKTDGSPAFPHEADYVLDHKTGKTTFRVDFHPGMTLRDWFAGQALIVAMLSKNNDGVDEHLKINAAMSYRVADAMLAERDKGADNAEH